MKINVSIQARLDMTLPLMPVKSFTGSALPLEIDGIPVEMAGGKVTAVTATVTNASAVPATGACTKVGNVWMTLFAASNFDEYGFVAKGIKIAVTVTRADLSTANIILAAGDFQIVASSASAQPGDPSRSYVVKGSDVYLKSYIVGEVQHYVKQTMEYDSQIGWGANWSGDYILVNGEFIPFVQNQGDAQ